MYTDSHYKVRPYYIYNGNCYTDIFILIRPSASHMVYWFTIHEMSPWTNDDTIHAHPYASLGPNDLTHICVGTLTIISSDNGLSPGRRKAIIRTNVGILLIGPLGTHFNEILIRILTFSFNKMRLKVSPAKWRPFCLAISVSNKTVDCSMSSWASLLVSHPEDVL